MSNSPEFTNAVNFVNKLKQKPSNEELINLYKHYKQSVEGDNNKPKPSFLNIKETAKWNAWTSVKGMSKYQSEVNYITLVNTLIKKYGV